MKLIIDIPKGTYRAIEVGTINQVLEYKVWNAIKNGTPFDSVIEDIKAEIIHYNDKHCNSEFISVGTVFEIIDKHISGEGDKEC